MKNNKTGRHKKPFIKYFVLSTIVLGGLFIFIIASKESIRQFSTKSNLKKFAELLYDEGINNVVVNDGCEADPSVKYGVRKLCGYKLTHSFMQTDRESLPQRFDKIATIINKQTIYDVKGSLSNNTELYNNGKYTYATLIDKSSNKECSASFGYEVSVLEKNLLELTIWCSSR